MKRLRRPRRQMASINVVPYIDVMLVLLVIFMITTPLLTQGVEVTLPQATSKALNLDQTIPIIVTVDRSGLYYVNVSPTPTVPVTDQELLNLATAELLLDQQENHPRPVFVKGDQEANYGQVVRAMVILQKAGAPSVGMLTKNDQISS